MIAARRVTGTVTRCLELEEVIDVGVRPNGGISRVLGICFIGALGRPRVRGKDCVLPVQCHVDIALVNSFLPERADTGPMG